MVKKYYYFYKQFVIGFENERDEISFAQRMNLACQLQGLF